MVIFAVIAGISIDSVTRASEKIQSIIDEVSCLLMWYYYKKCSEQCNLFFGVSSWKYVFQ